MTKIHHTRKTARNPCWNFSLFCKGQKMDRFNPTVLLVMIQAHSKIKRNRREKQGIIEKGENGIFQNARVHFHM